MDPSRGGPPTWRLRSTSLRGHHSAAEHEAIAGDAAAPLGPGCDEDNPLTTAAPGAIDRPLPEAIVQFERRLGWGYVHRGWHETRQWDYIAAVEAYADRYAYALGAGWKRAAVQEGAPGSGLEFLAMHRAMLGSLRARFPEHAALFDGWATVPTEATEADPLPPGPDGAPPREFLASMRTTLARLADELGTFAGDDDLGRFLETQHRPTDADPFARASEGGVGIHTYFHVRFDDARSPIRMQSFARNLEGEVFFRVHGWIDRVWTRYRAARGLDDATDAAYREAMHHACMHTRLGDWDGARHACAD